MMKKFDPLYDLITELDALINGFDINKRLELQRMALYRKQYDEIIKHWKKYPGLFSEQQGKFYYKKVLVYAQS